MKVVFTGGHHSSALPVLDLLRQKHSDVQIFWFGHKHSVKKNKNTSLEYREIKQRDIPFYNLHAGKFYRTYDPIRLAKIPIGFLQALYLLLKIRPKLVVSFGGYLAVPTVLAAKILRIPSITHEQTVVVGHANTFISKFADKILVSWEQSKKHFSEKLQHKITVTGLPLRKAIFDRSKKFDVNRDLPTLFILAGKTGSHIINLAVEEALPKLLNMCNVIHQTGDVSTTNDYDRLKKKYNSIKDQTSGTYIPKKFVFEDEIGSAFAAADVVVCRAGAHTIMELLALKKPCILIPIPWVSHNEQFENAQIVKNEGLGEVLEQKDLTSDSLVNAVREMFNNLSNYSSKSKSISYVELGAPENILNEIEKYL